MRQLLADVLVSLFDKSKLGSCLASGGAVGHLFGRRHITDPTFLHSRPSCEGCRKAYILCRNNIRDIFFDGRRFIGHSTRLLSSENSTEINRRQLCIELFGVNGRAKCDECQSSEYQFHINPLRISPNKARLPHFGNGEGMIMVQHSASLVNRPLFIAPEQAEINRLQSERETLQRRINLMRPHSHKRVELEARLRTVTARQLAISAQIERPQ